MKTRNVKLIAGLFAVFTFFYCSDYSSSKKGSPGSVKVEEGLEEKEMVNQEERDSTFLIEKGSQNFDLNVKGVLKQGSAMFSLLEKKETKKVEGGTFEGINSIVPIETIVFDDGARFDFKENEEVISHNQGFVFTQKKSIGENETYLNKYEIVGNNLSLIKTIGFSSVEYSIYPTNTETPSFLISDSGDGGGSKYVLYSTELKKIIEYRPYNAWFQNGIIDTKESFFLIVTESPTEKGLYKFCLIDSDKGEIVNSKEIQLTGLTLYSGFISEAGILMSGYQTSPYESKCFLFNSSFDKIWETKTETTFNQVQYLPSQQLFYCNGNTTKIYTLNNRGQQLPTIDLMDVYPYDEKRFDNPRTTVVLYDFIPLSNSSILATLTQKTVSNGQSTFENTALIVLDSNKVNQTIKLPEETSSLKVLSGDSKELLLLIGQKINSYEIF